MDANLGLAPHGVLANPMAPSMAKESGQGKRPGIPDGWRDWPESICRQLIPPAARRRHPRRGFPGRSAPA